MECTAILQVDALRPALSKLFCFTKRVLQVDTLRSQSWSVLIFFTKRVLHVDALHPGLSKLIFFTTGSTAGYIFLWKRSWDPLRELCVSLLQVLLITIQTRINAALG